MKPEKSWRESTDDPLEDFMVHCMTLPDGERSHVLAEYIKQHPEQAEEALCRFQILHSLGVEQAPSLQEKPLPERLGDFRLIRTLGGGGMGIVYLAEQMSLGREVALKLIRPDHLLFPRARIRFRREIEAVAGLHHPGIVGIHTVGEDGGVPFFAMERIHGRTLAEVLQTVQNRAPESLKPADLQLALTGRTNKDSGVPAPAPFESDWTRSALNLVRQVAEALHYAHEKGVIHRDVKPSNIAVTKEGKAVLLDFGLATSTVADGFTRSGVQLGTVQYMSPEQIRGEQQLTRGTDIYSLGVTLYQLLSLHPPFDGESRLTLERVILGGSVPSLRARNPKVSNEVELVCAKAMELDPRRRYETAAEFAEDLKRLLERRPILARPPSLLLRMRRWTQRNPVQTTALSLTFLLASGIPSALAVQANSHSWDLRESLHEQTKRAEEREAVADFLVGLFRNADPTRQNGESLTAKEILERGREHLDQALFDSPTTRATVLIALGEIYGNLQLNQEAQPLLEEAVATCREEKNVDLLAKALTSLGSNLSALNEREEAAEMLQEAIDLRRSLYGLNDWRTATSRSMLASLRVLQGNAVQALPVLREAAETMAADAKSNPGHVGSAFANLGATLRYLAAHESGEKRESMLVEAQESLQKALTAFDQEPKQYKVAKANALRTLGQIYQAQEKWSEAEVHYRNSLAQWLTLVGMGPVPVERSLLNSIAEMLRQQGRHKKAADAFVVAFHRSMEISPENDSYPVLHGSWIAQYLGRLGLIESLTEILAEIPDMPQGYEQKRIGSAARAWAQQGYAYAVLGDYSEAKNLLNKSLTLLEEANKKPVLHTLRVLLDIHIIQEEKEEAQILLDQIRGLGQTEEGPMMPSVKAVVDWGVARIRQGDDDFDSAAEHYRQCLAYWKEDKSLPTKILLGSALLELGELEEAESMLRLAEERLQQTVLPLDGLLSNGETWLEACQRLLAKLQRLRAAIPTNEDA